MHNIDYEMKLLDLLGYNLIGPNNSNRWIITDKDNNQVGYIQYKKVYKGNKKKEYQKEFAYIMFIDSKEIVFNNTRKVSNDGNNYSYMFDIKRENSINDHVELDIIDINNMHLCIWSKEYGFSSLKIDYDGLYVYFKSKTDNFNIEEVVSYSNTNDYLANYFYQIKYCKKNRKLSDNRYVTTREIGGYSNGVNRLNIFERVWNSKYLIKDNNFDTNGSIEEMINMHEMGILAFSHYRYLLNKILPFDKDIIDEVITSEIVDNNDLSLFINKDDNKKILI